MKTPEEIKAALEDALRGLRNHGENERAHRLQTALAGAADQLEQALEQSPYEVIVLKALRLLVDAAQYAPVPSALRDELADMEVELNKEILG